MAGKLAANFHVVARFVGHQATFFAEVCPQDWRDPQSACCRYELADAPYRSERTEAWQKIKTVINGKFPVVGFVKDPTGVAALYLGKKEGKELVYMSKVRTGWSRTVSSQIRKQLDTVVSPKSKLTKAVKKPRATWAEPVFFADIEYRDITSDGLLRQSSFKGLKRN